MVFGHPSRSALAATPPITSSRISTQPTTRHCRRGRTGRERHDVESDDDGDGSRAQPAKNLRALVMQSSAPAPGASSAWDSSLGAIEDSISQCTFLQMTYTAKNQHADCIAASGARPCFHPPLRCDPHATSPAPTTTGCREDRCPVVSKRPLHSLDAAKMSPHIRIGPEPVLAAHDQSPKILFCNGELNLLLQGSGCLLQAGTGHGLRGLAPG